MRSRIGGFFPLDDGYSDVFFPLNILFISKLEQFILRNFYLMCMGFIYARTIRIRLFFSFLFSLLFFLFLFVFFLSIYLYFTFFLLLLFSSPCLFPSIH